MSGCRERLARCMYVVYVGRCQSASQQGWGGNQAEQSRSTHTNARTSALLGDAEMDASRRWGSSRPDPGALAPPPGPSSSRRSID